MAINLNNQNQGIGTLDLSEYGLIQPATTNTQVADAYTTPTEGDYGFSLIELDRLKRGGYNPEEVSTWENKDDVQSLIRSLEPQASVVNEYGYPLMASLSGAIPNKVSAIDQMANYDWSGFDNNIAKNIALANAMNTTLDNTLMSEALIDEDRIPGRIQKSVPNYQNWFERMMSGAQNKLGGAWDKTKEIGTRFKEGAAPVFGRTPRS